MLLSISSSSLQVSLSLSLMALFATGTMSNPLSTYCPPRDSSAPPSISSRSRSLFQHRSQLGKALVYSCIRWLPVDVDQIPLQSAPPLSTLTATEMGSELVPIVP